MRGKGRGEEEEDRGGENAVCRRGETAVTMSRAKTLCHLLMLLLVSSHSSVPRFPCLQKGFITAPISEVPYENVGSQTVLKC